MGAELSPGSRAHLRAIHMRTEQYTSKGAPSSTVVQGRADPTLDHTGGEAVSVSAGTCASASQLHNHVLERLRRVVLVQAHGDC